MWHVLSPVSSNLFDLLQGMHMMHVKKSEVDSVSNQLQDADDLESSVGSIALGGDAVNHHGPTPYIVVREFPAWIDRGRSAYTSDNIQPQPHNLQSAQNNQHNILQKSHFNRFSAKDNKGHYHQNGDLVHTISQQFVTEAGPDIVNAENAKQLINQLGLIQYKKPGEQMIFSYNLDQGVFRKGIFAMFFIQFRTFRCISSIKKFVCHEACFQPLHWSCR